MSYQTEFPDFDPATMPLIPKSWADDSWHNNVSPSFDTKTGKVVFVDYLDPDKREYPNSKRFIVQTTNCDLLMETDNWVEVLVFLIDQEGR